MLILQRLIFVFTMFYIYICVLYFYWVNAFVRFYLSDITCYCFIFFLHLRIRLYRFLFIPLDKYSCPFMLFLLYMCTFMYFCGILPFSRFLFIPMPTVCQLPYYLDIATHLCVSSCAAGHYQSYERVNEREERKPIQHGKSSEGLFEAKEQEAFEDEERFYNGRVCHPCARYCHSCSGPKPVDCHQCTHGAQYQPHNSSCIMIVNNTPDQGGAFFYVAITAIVFVGLVFVILFIRSWSGCSWFRMSGVSYKYLPTGDGSVDQLDSTEEYRDDPNDSESDQPKAQLHSKGVMNGHAPNNGYIVNSKPDRLMNDVISS